MDELQKMLAKRKKSSSKGKSGEGKMKALKGLRSMMNKMMGGAMDKNMKNRVTVMAKDKAGLKKGLDKAEEMLDSESSKK